MGERGFHVSPASAPHFQVSSLWDSGAPLAGEGGRCPSKGHAYSTDSDIRYVTLGDAPVWARGQRAKTDGRLWARPQRGQGQSG